MKKIIESQETYDVDLFLKIMIGASSRGFSIKFDYEKHLITITNADGDGYKFIMERDYELNGVPYTMKNLEEDFLKLLAEKIKKESSKSFSSKNQLKPFLIGITLLVILTICLFLL